MHTFLHLRTISFLLAFLPIATVAQCLSGDCKNGQGKYDYGYAIYDGSFRNGKAHGHGTMDYGGGEKFVGNFVDGKEEGEGVMYKNGTSKTVSYKAGILMVRKETPVVIGGNKVRFDGGVDCNGDCNDGYGTAKFPSGNVYTGNFRSGLFHGKGIMRFASGNVLDGEFENHYPVHGSFTYAGSGIIFNGNFNKDGTPATGTYNSAQSGGKVEVQNGAITKVSNPRLDSIKAAQPKYANQKCTRCNGAGYTTSTKTTYEQLTPNVYQASSTGFASLIREGQSLKSSHKSFDNCAVCAGKGQVEVRQKK
ncbi:MAG: hypothetical protein V4717_09270 [Bacteroidota bacterium]